MKPRCRLGGVCVGVTGASVGFGVSGSSVTTAIVALPPASGVIVTLSNTITLLVGFGVGVVPSCTVPQSFQPFPPPSGGVGVGVWMPEVSPPKIFCVSMTIVSGVTATVAVGARVWKGRAFPAPVGAPVFTSSGAL